ncbi:MAG TPA: ATP synthase F1 subunit gamma [Acidimicrobiales bacterium]|jgi:F-type H+-transporting ATPase subunit gamma|nr:ATP synthase F1 subunit gamma [Acidimicrobiales bacterium]
MAGGKERELRGRIRSINATKKITRAMELIAASQIGRARARIAGSAPYVDGIEAVLAQTARDAGEASRLVGRPDQPASVMVVLLAGDRGQAGAYNSSVFRQAERLIVGHVEEGRANRLVTVGRKAIGYFRFRGQTPAVSFTSMSDRPTFEDARKIAAEITGPFLSGEVDLVELVSTRYVSAGTQVVKTIQVLPLELPEARATDGDTVLVDHSDGGGFYDYEPDPADLLRLLVPRYTEAVIFRALLEASASEHTARQRAMAAATENAEELITNYSRQMNRARQDSITTEIMEIVSGAEALRSAGQRSIDVDELLRATEEQHA